EILPAEKTRTSGSTKEVEGQAVIKDQKVEEGTIVVDMTSLTTDKKSYLLRKPAPRVPPRKLKVRQ
ncbi:hypothetical protein HT105_25290, partial [Bacteroides fragilis]|nr:hypothetical protein [Bacteroides fragilis]